MMGSLLLIAMFFYFYESKLKPIQRRKFIRYQIGQKIHALKKYNKEDIQDNAESRQRVFELYCLSQGVDGLSVDQQEFVKEYYRQCITVLGLDFFGTCVLTLEKVSDVEKVAICKNKFFELKEIANCKNQMQNTLHPVTNLREPIIYYWDSLAEDVMAESHKAARVIQNCFKATKQLKNHGSPTQYAAFFSGG